MLNRLFTSSFKVARSALLWAVIAVAAIEHWAGTVLPGAYFSHEVDHLLYDLNRKDMAAPTLFLGDSVAHQLCRSLDRETIGPYATLAANSALETAGQYYLLERFLDRNPAPDRVVLIMVNPTFGNLAQGYTENYIQRCFLRWHEIVQMTRMKGDPRFGLVMLGYKLSPSFRYRLHLQNEVPFLRAPNIYAGGDQGMNLPAPNRFDAISALWGLVVKPPSLSVSSRYLERLARKCADEKIVLYYYPTPTTETEYRKSQDSALYRALTDRLRELAGEFPGFHALDVHRVYPDSQAHEDGVHFLPDALPAIRRDVEQDLTRAFRKYEPRDIP